MSTSKFATGKEGSKSKSLRKFEVDIFRKTKDNEWMGDQIDHGFYNNFDENGRSSPMSG